MNTKFFQKLITVLVVFMLVSCKAGQDSAVEPEKKTVAMTTMATPISLLTPTRSATSSPENTMTPIPSLTDTQLPTVSAEVIGFSNCPQVLAPDSPAIIKNGSVLFTYTGLNALEGVWNLSARETEAQIAFQPTMPANKQVFLSPSGTKLVWDDFSKEPEEMVIDDLGTQQRSRFTWHEDWMSVWGWTVDGRVKILLDIIEDEDNGLYSEMYALYDTQSGKVEDTSVQLHIPGYTSLGGSFSIDPENKLVLYSAIKDFPLRTEAILRHIGMESDLWSMNGIQVPPFPKPDWSRDGNKVVMGLWLNQEGFMKIFSLSRDGQHLEELTHQPLGWLAQEAARVLRWSPDGRYLYFSLWRSVSEGPAFILDTENSEIREICTPGYAFLNGEWLPNGHQFVYTVRLGDYGDESKIRELRIVDIDSWTEQTLVVFEGEETEINILGWTPLVFP